MKELISKPLNSVFVFAILLFAFQQGAEARYAGESPTNARCSDEADARGLHGVERKEFRSRCKANGGQAATIPSQRKNNVAKPVVNALPDKAVAAPKAAVLPQEQKAPIKTSDVATAPISAAAYGRRIALVIGNSDYKNVPALSNPRNDATSIADALKRTGFTAVDLELDLGRDRLVSTLRNFAQQAGSADWAVVYYAGHGMEVGGINYVIPIDAKIVEDRDISFEAIPLDQVLNATERAKQLHLVVLDACRNNPFSNQMKRTLSVASRSVSRGLAAVEPEAGTLVVFSAKAGETSLDGDGINSPFATALLRNLETPGLEVRRLFDFVRDDVLDATQSKQKPFSYGSISGRQDFYFVSPK